MTEEESKAQYQRCPVQINALYNLNDELDSLLHANCLKSDAVDGKTVRNWLRMLHDIVRDGLERPRYPFPDKDTMP